MATYNNNSLAFRARRANPLVALAMAGVSLMAIPGCVDQNPFAFLFGNKPTVATQPEHSVTADAAAPLFTGGLADVPMEYRPKFRWWWPTDQVDVAELYAELDVMHKAGIGGVEISLLRNPTRFGSPAFRERVKAVLIRANALGMTVDMTLGAAWPVSSPSIDDVAKNLSSQDLVYGAVDVIGPVEFVGNVPKPVDSGLLNQRLMAVTAARLAFPFQPADPNVSREPGAAPLLEPIRLDPTGMVDITSHTDDNGTMRWQVPEGHWRLFGFWSRATAQRTHGDLPSLIVAALQTNAKFDLGLLGPVRKVTGHLIIDHFSRAAMETALADFDTQLFADDMAPLWQRNGGYLFQDSLELHHNQGKGGSPLNDQCICYAKFWTPAFLAEFEQRRGYDLTPLLPAVFNSYDFPEGGGDRIERDYDETLMDLFIANNMQPMNEFAQARGMKARVQAYGLSNFDTTRAAAGAPTPETESLHFMDTGTGVKPGSETSRGILDNYRAIASGVHISGAAELTMEAGATRLRGGGSSPEDYKLIADRAFASGVTTPILHGFAYRTFRDAYIPHSGWPGWDPRGSIFAESWNQLYPQMAKWPALAGYMGRASAVLRQGKPAVDLIVLRHNVGTEITLADKEPKSTVVRDALQPNGYSWDVVGDLSLGEFPDVPDGRLLPDAAAYKAVVIENLSQLSEHTASRLLDFASAGLPVVVIGEMPSRGISYRDARGEDERVQGYMNGLLALGNVRIIETAAELPPALLALGVEPDMQADAPTTLVAQHRRLPQGDLWFVYNNGAEQSTGEIAFAAQGKPYRMDLWTGVSKSLAHYSIEEDRTRIALNLKPGEATVLSFDAAATPSVHVVATDAAEVIYGADGLLLRDMHGGNKVATLSDGSQHTVTLPTLPKARELTGPWTLHATTVDLNGNQEKTLRLNTLADWRKIPALRTAAGTGIYTHTFTLPKDWIREGRGVLIDPGQVGGMMELFVNGKAVPAPAIADGPRDISAQLRPGKNEIRIEVATTLINRLRGRAWEGDGRYFLFAFRPSQPYGLIGPVRLIPFAAVALRN